MGSRRSFALAPIIVNGIRITHVIIDTHYEKKHADYMSDSLILKLVEKLDGRREFPEARTANYSYFATLIEHNNKQYRLIWLLEDHAIYVGVVNAYRDKRRK